MTTTMAPPTTRQQHEDQDDKVDEVDDDVSCVPLDIWPWASESTTLQQESKVWCHKHLLVRHCLERAVDRQPGYRTGGM